MAVVCGSWLCSACGSGDKDAQQADSTVVVAAQQTNQPQTNVRCPELLDTQEVISRSFVKDDFSKYCVAATRQDFDAGMLNGMSLNSEASDAGRLCFWAVVGWCGEGPTFRVYIQPGSNQVSIEQDFSSVDNSMPEETM